MFLIKVHSDLFIRGMHEQHTNSRYDDAMCDGN